MYQIAHVERDLIQHIYSGGDIKFAAALIKLGASFDVSNLFPAMLRHDYSVPRWHINDIRGVISQDEYHIVHDVLDSWYSNNYVKQANQITYFYPPDILASATKTNSPEYIRKIYDLYVKLYESESTIIKDVITIAAVTILRNPNSVLLIPVITDHIAIEYAQCINLDTNKGVAPSCLIPSHTFSSFEIGRFMHELTHFAMEGLFHNDNNPYIRNSLIKKQEYEFACKQMITNISSLASIQFTGDIYNSSTTVLDLRNLLFAQKKMMLYTVPDRIGNPIKVGLLAKIFFGNDTALSENSEAKYLKAWHKAAIVNNNISKSVEIALERIGDWITYPDDELNRELVARFVELHYRSEELGAVNDALNAMMTYWPTITHAGKKFQDSLHLTRCYGSKNYTDESIEYEYYAMNQVTECLLIGDLLSN